MSEWAWPLVIGTVLTVLGFFLRKAIEDIAKRLDGISADVKAVMAKVDDHATRLAKVEVMVEQFREARLSIERIDREGCARRCRFPGEPG
jgi:hypothetical protein